MKSSLCSRSLGLVMVLMIAAGIVSGCAPDASAEIISPELGAQLYAREASADIVVEPTPEPLRIANLSPEEIFAGLPGDFAAALVDASPASGETVALTYGCIGCHAVDPAQQMTGPTWYHMGDTAANREPGVGPAAYLYESIIAPNANVVSGYPSGVMPQNYEETIPQDELADLVAYLLAQQE